MPFSDAVYVSGVNKIFGTMGPYVVKCNATTGVKEASVRVAPIYGECRICYLAATGLLYVSTWNDPARLFFTDGFHAYGTQIYREIFPVDPATLTVGAGLGIDAKYGCASGSGFYHNMGPMALQAIENRVYFAYTLGFPVGSFYYYYDSVTGLTYNNFGTLWFGIQHLGYDPGGGVDAIYFPYGFDPGIRTTDIDLSYNTYNDTLPYYPSAAVWCPAVNKAFVVCGNTTLIRVDSMASHTYTLIDMSTAQFNADPARIRYNPSDQKLYMPCPTPNGILVWNPAASTGVFKGGFDNPVDVIFTGSKIFAVQNSFVGLKEVV